MQFETLGKKIKKKILIGGIVALSFVSVISFVTTRAKYTGTQNLKLANGTVNYKSADLELVAIKVSEDRENYVSSETIPIGDYIFNEEKSKCRIPTETLKGENAPVDNNVSVEYADGKINIYGMTTQNTRCYIYFDKKSGETVATAFGKIEVKSDIPDFTEVAIGAETEANNGIFETDDPMYKTVENPNPKTYYWRGAATSNHVIFANKCWRIVRINGDGTIRLIFNGTVNDGKCTGNGVSNVGSIVKKQTYSIDKSTYNNSSYVGWTYTVGSQRPTDSVPQTSGTASGIKTVTEEWFNDNSNFTAAQRAKVVEGKFCNDRRTKNDETWRETGSTQYYAAYARLFEGTKTPSLDCANGDIYYLKVGAITADEVQFAGASAKTTNNSYYLYNGQQYWTMSPYHWSNINTYASVFSVLNTTGYLFSSGLHDVGGGVRPVINLNADTAFNAGGNGTADNPYVVQ